MNNFVAANATKQDVAAALKSTAKGQLSYDTSLSFDSFQVRTVTIFFHLLLAEVRFEPAKKLTSTLYNLWHIYTTWSGKRPCYVLILLTGKSTKLYWNNCLVKICLKLFLVKFILGALRPVACALFQRCLVLSCTNSNPTTNPIPDLQLWTY